MIETLHAVEKIRELLHEQALQGDDLVTPPGERRGEYVAMIEAPRGTLTHHYRVDENDQVTMANLIVSTTCNNESMNRTVRRIAEDHLSGVPEITEPLLNNIEVGIRAYDPCLSCATHALGQMPLEVTLIDHNGAILGQRTRS
jgi:NAD-reducing hydrogenase large subunit